MPKHEAFAQALAAGKCAGDAYKNAGFAPSYANASRLQRQDHIRRRVDEILARKQCAVDRAVANAAERIGLTEEWVLRRLRTNAVLAARRGDTAASNRATELIGRHLGLFIDRKEIQINYVDDADAYLAQLMEIVQSRTIEHEPAAQPADSVGSEDGSDQDS
jgi:hypothetical protein